MSENDSQFAALMQLVAQRDDRAIAELLHRYNDTLLSCLCGRLRRCPLLRTLFDAEWIANGIWADLLRTPAKLKQFATPEKLVSYIRGMARNQVRKTARDHLDTKKRDLRRRRHLSDAAATAAAGVVADPRPTPAEYAEALDDWNQWLRSSTEQERQWILLRGVGFTFLEIAAEFGCSERTIERNVSGSRSSRFV